MLPLTPFLAHAPAVCLATIPCHAHQHNPWQPHGLPACPQVDLVCNTLLGAGSLPHLRHVAHLDLDVGWPAPPGSGTAGGAGGAGVAAGLVDMMDPDGGADGMGAAAWQPQLQAVGQAAGGQGVGREAAAVQAQHAAAAEASRGLVPVRQLLAALVAAAQPGGEGASGQAGGAAAGSGLMRLRELVLRLPEVRMRPVEHTQEERRRQADALREQLLRALGPLGQVSSRLLTGRSCNCTHPRHLGTAWTHPQLIVMHVG